MIFTITSAISVVFYFASCEFPTRIRRS